MANRNSNPTGGTLSRGKLVAPYISRRDDQIRINGVEYVCENTTREGHTLVRVDNGLPETFSHEEIQRLIEDGDLEVRNGHYHPGRAEVSRLTGGKQFQDLSYKEQAKVLFKKAIGDRYLEREKQEHWIARTEDKLRIVIRQIMAERDASNRDRRDHERCGHHIGVQEKEPSPKTLRRWLYRYQRADYDEMALLDYYNWPMHISRLSEEAYEIHSSFVREYATRKKATKAQIYRRLSFYIERLNEERGEGEPKVEKLSLRTFERMIDSFDVLCTEVGRWGSEETSQAASADDDLFGDPADWTST